MNAAVAHNDRDLLGRACRALARAALVVSTCLVGAAALQAQSVPLTRPTMATELWSWGAAARVGNYDAPGSATTMKRGGSRVVRGAILGGIISGALGALVGFTFCTGDEHRGSCWGPTARGFIVAVPVGAIIGAGIGSSHAQ